MGWSKKAGDAKTSQKKARYATSQARARDDVTTSQMRARDAASWAIPGTQELPFLSKRGVVSEKKKGGGCRSL